MIKKIELKDISKEFKNHKVLENVNISFENGKIYGLIGRNGSGKSVLMKVISGLILPNKGKIMIDDEIYNGKFPKDLGILFDEVGMLPHLSAFENLKLLASIRNKIDDKTIRDFIEVFGLDGHDKRKIKDYSLGMKQKVGIVSALMEDPNLILLDEPMNGMDEESVKELREILISLKNKNKIIIITSHNKEDIEILCDEVYKVNAGAVLKI
ncbi:MAG: ABC transporter ATP-binding protein [Sarcina sp.]